MFDGIISAEVSETSVKGDVSAIRKPPKMSPAQWESMQSRLDYARKLVGAQKVRSARALMDRVKKDKGKGISFHHARTILGDLHRSRRTARRVKQPTVSAVKSILQQLTAEGITSAVFADGQWTVTRVVTETM